MVGSHSMLDVMVMNYNEAQWKYESHALTDSWMDYAEVRQICSWYLKRPCVFETTVSHASLCHTQHKFECNYVNVVWFYVENKQTFDNNQSSGSGVICLGRCEDSSRTRCWPKLPHRDPVEEVV